VLASRLGWSCLLLLSPFYQVITIPKTRQKTPRCVRKRRDKKYRKDKSPTMFSLAEGCGCVSFRGGRRTRSLGDDSSSCRSSEIEQEVPKKLGKRILKGECTMKALAPFLKFWKRDEVSMTKAERRYRNTWHPKQATYPVSKERASFHQALARVLIQLPRKNMTQQDIFG
ncbi:jg655, partial [Pararge aegeria aegeria]